MQYHKSPLAVYEHLNADLLKGPSHRFGDFYPDVNITKKVFQADNSYYTDTKANENFDTHKGHMAPAGNYNASFQSDYHSVPQRLFSSASRTSSPKTARTTLASGTPSKDTPETSSKKMHANQWKSSTVRYFLNTIPKPAKKRKPLQPNWWFSNPKVFLFLPNCTKSLNATPEAKAILRPLSSSIMCLTLPVSMIKTIKKVIRTNLTANKSTRRLCRTLLSISEELRSRPV
jgi:hypothetical protein